jgi:hypothetical protein
MRPANLSCHKNSCKNSNGPPESNNNPSTLITLRSVQYNIGHYTIAKQNKQKGSNDLSSEYIHKLMVLGFINDESAIGK